MLDRRRIFIGLAAIILLPCGYIAMGYLYWALLYLLDWPVPFPFHGLVGPAILLVLGPTLYFLPTIIGRHKRNMKALLALNLLLGWTFLGWIGALIWALLREDATTKPAVARSE